MSTGQIPLREVEEKATIPACDNCAENGCSVELDRMSDRVVFRPDDEDTDEKRADCAIFYPRENESDSQLYRNRGGEGEDPVAEFLSIVELKSTVSRPQRIEQQIAGALDFALDVLERCCDPPWNIRCFCVISKDRVRIQHKDLRRIRVKRHIGGDTRIFRPTIVDSGSSLREIAESEGTEDVIREI
jgi:hypothetical protein